MKAPEKIYFAPVSPGEIDYSNVTSSKLIDVFEDMRHYQKKSLELSHFSLRPRVMCKLFNGFPSGYKKPLTKQQAKMDMIARRRAMRQHQEGIYMSKKRGPTAIIAEGPMIGMPVCVYRGTAYRYNQKN